MVLGGRRGFEKSGHKGEGGFRRNLLVSQGRATEKPMVKFGEWRIF